MFKGLGEWELWEVHAGRFKGTSALGKSVCGLPFITLTCYFGSLCTGIAKTSSSI